MILKQILGLDQLHWAFLFIGFAVAGLVFMLWYPELIGNVGWERGEYITTDSLIARIISSLIVSFMLWLLYILDFWLLLRKTSGSRGQYHEDKRIHLTLKTTPTAYASNLDRVSKKRELDNFKTDQSSNYLS